MNNLEFVNKLKDIASDYKTLYVHGCFGAPMTTSNKKRYCNNTSYNKKPERTEKIQNADASTFGFDCVNLIKGVLWGWTGDKTKTYGGAKYNSNNVPDINADAMINECDDLSTDFTSIEIGEAVWIKGHIGVYVGDGLVVECTPKWKDGVQFTACNRTKTGYNRRNWTKHGKLPYITYTKISASTSTTSKPASTCSLTAPVLKQGVKGNSVKALQILLIGYGFSCGNSGADGNFGTNTNKAVKSFQTKNKLTADGVVGKNTWECLLGFK